MLPIQYFIDVIFDGLIIFEQAIYSYFFFSSSAGFLGLIQLCFSIHF